MSVLGQQLSLLHSQVFHDPSGPERHFAQRAAKPLGIAPAYDNHVAQPLGHWHRIQPCVPLTKPTGGVPRTGVPIGGLEASDEGPEECEDDPAGEARGERRGRLPVACVA